VRSLLRIAAQVAAGKQQALQVYGRDYDTPDGTCIRDYIHVVDLADAHAGALDYLSQGGNSEVFNVGYSQGHSVLEVARAMQNVSDVEFPVEWAERRSCDPVSVVARAEKIKEKLGWEPRFKDLDEICRTAFLWEMRGLPQKLQIG
jgi:UDP-glucose 4-epimerase